LVLGVRRGVVDARNVQQVLKQNLFRIRGCLPLLWFGGLTHGVGVGVNTFTGAVRSGLRLRVEHSLLDAFAVLHLIQDLKFHLHAVNTVHRHSLGLSLFRLLPLGSQLNALDPVLLLEVDLLVLQTNEQLTPLFLIRLVHRLGWRTAFGLLEFLEQSFLAQGLRETLGLLGALFLLVDFEALVQLRQLRLLVQRRLLGFSEHAAGHLYLLRLSELLLADDLEVAQDLA